MGYYDTEERFGVLSDVSVVAEGWKWPARRLLCKTVRIKSWKHLQEMVEDWAGGEVRNLHIDIEYWSTVPQELAKAVFGLLEKVPNLRQLRLDRIPFTSFDPPTQHRCRRLYSFPISPIS